MNNAPMTINLTGANNVSQVGLATLNGAGVTPVAGAINYRDVDSYSVGLPGFGIVSTGPVMLQADSGTVTQTQAIQPQVRN